MKNTFIKFLPVIAVLVLIIVISNSALAQCAMCKKIATDGVNTKITAKSLNSGILYLLSVPYIMVGVFFRKQIIEFIQSVKSKYFPK